MDATLRKALRPYQARLVADVCRSEGHVLVEQPTGSGKTLQIVTLVAMHLGKGFTHAVIAAPQQQIEHAFVQIHVHHLGAVLDLLLGHGQSTFKIAGEDEFGEFGGASDVGALADVNEIGLWANG